MQKELTYAASSEVFCMYERVPDGDSQASSTTSSCEGNGPYYLTFIPKDGTYRNQLHLLRLDFSYDHADIYTDAHARREFPKHPPLLRFMTGIFHPNISTSGYICVDVLGAQWNPLYRLDAIINSILLLLETPNCDSPLNCEASQMFAKNKNTYREYVCSYYREKNISNITDPYSGDGCIRARAIRKGETATLDLSAMITDHVKREF